MSRIESYSFGRMRVDGTDYTSDLIILPEGIIPSWWRKEGHNLQPEDIEAVLDAAPEVLVIGTGAMGMMSVSEGALSALREAGIEVLAERTGKAVETFNRVSQARRAAGAFHLTC